VPCQSFCQSTTGPPTSGSRSQGHVALLPPLLRRQQRNFGFRGAVLRISGVKVAEEVASAGAVVRAQGQQRFGAGEKQSAIVSAKTAAS